MAQLSTGRLGASEEVRELVKALTPKVQHCREALNTQEVGNALQGLQRLGNSEEVRMLFAAVLVVSLVPEVLKCRAFLDALWQLEGGGDAEKVRPLLKDLISEVQQCQKDYMEETRQDKTIGDAQHGLQRLGKSEGVQRLLFMVQDSYFRRNVDNRFEEFRRQSE